MIRVGTSGFKFADWKGRFYPEALDERKWLEYYAERFNTVEVNSTYYRLLPPATFFQMAKKVPEGFDFTVKAYRTSTHEIGPETAADIAAFKESLRPLIEAGKFGCVLAQFPTSFHNTPEARGHLVRFREEFAGYPLVIEFRNREWLEEAVFDFLRENEIGFCGVDEPQLKSLLPPLAVATSDIGYVRFHGRNAKKWWSGSKEERYDYLYSAEELREWAPRIRRLEQQTRRVYVFMNNCFAGQAAVNAGQMREILA
jgi:uncharacterized protein YecE (DUF72 family)